MSPSTLLPPTTTTTTGRPGVEYGAGVPNTATPQEVCHHSAHSVPQRAAPLDQESVEEDLLPGLG